VGDRTAERRAERIVAAIEAVADPVRAEGSRAYLKLERSCLGVRVPDVRRIVRTELGVPDPLDHDELVATADHLWAGEPHEHRLAAAELLGAGVAVLSVDDLGRLADLIAASDTWALVDPLAIGVVAPVVSADPRGAASVLDAWVVDPSFWVRRASLLALLPDLRAGHGDWERFCRTADAVLDEREFFVAKAIGWVLRDTSRRRPELVAAWVEPRLDRMSAVTRREALKYLALPARP